MRHIDAIRAAVAVLGEVHLRVHCHPDHLHVCLSVQTDEHLELLAAELGTGKPERCGNGSAWWLASGEFGDLTIYGPHHPIEAIR